ncbi:hypothetical protein [Bradyrhizobium sp. 151]|uniref:hypothetical protein n=1 Tax=Bradyrhizobium sp. 151 TaxID=2782626 RepID=UPI001FFBA66D|nr:hypothetical protein [Bradyrhizobium sp. 151]MCK1656186.1 hypothetical protein [Bradyrhizobium sp. 151]
MSAPATVFWTPEAAMMLLQPGTSIVHREKDRSFGNLDAALKFVMEDLPEGLRSTARIQTDNASIQFADIERLYKGRETGKGAQETR